eukprot:scaffold1072_cov356-Prasinococcus_capsulatus_cf.AAC.4
MPTVRGHRACRFPFRLHTESEGCWGRGLWGDAAALLVYDITDTESFDRVKAWVKELRSMAGKDIIITLAANKCDLEKNRQVSTEDGERYANSIDAQIFNTSAKLNKGVEQAFLNVTRRLVTKSRSNSGAGASGYGNKKSLLIVEDKPDKPKSSSCC